MRRVHVIGGSCTGKTTTARNLAELLGVPHIELDALHHDPNWTEVSAEVMQARVQAALAAAPDGWVVDGNYFGKLGDRVLEQADTVVWLDLPFRTALRRVVWRTFSRTLVRTELWNGNRELLRNALGRNSIILWVLRTHRAFPEKWAPRLAGHSHLEVVRLRTRREVGNWLQSIQASAEMSGSSNVSDRQNTPPSVER